MARVRLGISIEKLFVFTWRDILSTADNQILHSPDDKHLADRITADDLANLIDTSVGRLFRAFKASVGIPPLHYVACRRVEFACS